MKRGRIWAWSLGGLLGTGLGFLSGQESRLVEQLNAGAAARQGRVLQFLVTGAVRHNLELTAALNRVRARLRSVPKLPAPGSLTQQVAATAVQAGLRAQSGHGLEVVMHDATHPAYPGEPSQYRLIHDQYVLHIIADLSAAGARAIAINGQRVVATTAIFCAGPTIRVNGVPYGSPFVIRALGPAAAMQRALHHDPEVLGWQQLVSIHYGPQTVKIPAYSLPVHFSYAKPVNIGKALP